MLVRDALVRAQEDVEALLGQSQELAVFLSGPAGLGHGDDLVPLGAILLQTPVQVLVQEYAQLGLLGRLYDRLAVVAASVASKVLSVASKVLSR